MTEQWETKRLEDVAYTSGRIGWKGLTAKEYTSGGPLFLSVHGLNHGDFVDFRDAFHISQERYDESPEIMLRCNDILICKDGAGIGKLGIVGELRGPATINSSLLLIRALSGVLPKFLYFTLCSPGFQNIVQERIDGATTPHLYQREIKQFPIRLPSLSEQKRIVAILDEAFEGIDTAIANAKKNLVNARELFDSYLAFVFAENGYRWTEQKLGEICEFEGGSQPPKSEFVYLQAEGHVRFLQIRDFASDKNITYIPVSKKNRVCKDTDILIGRYGASVGKILTGKSGAYNVAIIKTIPNSRVISRSWFYNYLISSLFQSNLSKVASRSAQSGFSKDDIYNFPVPVPSLPDQAILTAKIQAISSESCRLRSIYRRKVEHLTELRQTLLERAFAGDLTVGSKDPLREAAE